jgi:phosphatidylserine/phosphatidylglycerophosphate/cardiolipin synthase-like enzyme
LKRQVGAAGACPRLHRITARGSLILLLALTGFACRLETAGLLTGPTPAVDSTQEPPEHESWYTVYFTDPNGQSSRSLRGGPDGFLAEAIRQARVRVDVAVLQLDLWSIRNALLDAHRRGVEVRVVIDSDYLEGKEVQELVAGGISVLGDRREGLMHDKFAVIDGQEVWTGSMNLTVNDAYRNNNNLIRIRSAQLAENYTTEFEEMFLSDRFGPGSPADTPHPMITIDTTRVENYFSPDDGVAARLVRLLNGAQESIYFLAYSFTSDALAQAMLERARSGVTVAGVMEATQSASNFGSEFDRLVSAGLGVYLDGNPRNMHHKVLIIDRRILVVGSYNFSDAAETSNDENVLIIENPEIAGTFLEEFDRIVGEAKNR